MTKTSLLLAALLTTVAVTAQAAELYSPEATPASSTLTRAQVRQSVLAARQSGELDHDDVDLPPAAASTEAFGKTRAAVRAETLAARANGGLDHDDVDLPDVARGSVLTRQQVKTEAIASRALVHTTPGHNTIAY